MHIVSQIRRRIKADLSTYWPGLLLAAAYYTLSSVIFHEVCPLLLLTGIPCPSCGMTRAVCSLLMFDFAQSWAMHPLALPTILLILCAASFRYVLGRSLKPLLWPAIGLLLAALVLYAIRMTLYFPHTAPMQYLENSLFSLIKQLLQ